MNAASTARSFVSEASSVTHLERVVFDGIARHVSVEGCQFMIVEGVPDVGSRFSITIADEMRISGTVSWALGDRIGFAFDRRIGPGAMSELSAHLRSLTMVPLWPCLPQISDEQHQD